MLNNGSGRRKACQASTKDKSKQPLQLFSIVFEAHWMDEYSRYELELK